ncbi:MAG: helicase [Chloroflexi bacterium]|nr:helicase [Chloroflexota bacterium]
MPKLKPEPFVIEINEQFKHALDIIENTPKSAFITGRAGTGKSTLLDYFRRNTRKRVVVLAPTGVAALNVKGQTIHSFFKFKPNVTLSMVKKLQAAAEGGTIYQKLDAIVIDEISMVRADLLDCVDKFLRLNGPSPEEPFGGIQMIFIGDLYQLPPVITSLEKAEFKQLYKTPYFYSSRAFDGLNMEFIELEKIYRQHDPEFIQLLNTVRNKSITYAGLELLNQRFNPTFEPPPGDFYVYLTTTNELASTINKRRLSQLDSPQRTFIGEIEGDFGDEYLPTAIELQVKIGAQIMMLNNDSDNRWVNGTLGEITGITRDKNGDCLIIAGLPDGEVEIEPFTWEIYRFQVKGGTLQSEVVGTFTQYPLMLAWAITIHKSQGKTFEKVVIDIGKGTFAHGQLYVALSRCTTLEGIVLRRPILKKHIWTDFQVMDFLTRYQYRKSEKRLSLDDRLEIIRRAIKNASLLRITYLKPTDEKSERTVRPHTVGEMEYQGKTYLGLRAFCLKRNEDRTFRVDRILDIKEMPAAEQELAGD